MELKIENICKSYKNKHVLNDINFIFTPGVYGLIGPNGAGKTTLINIITGLLKQDSGNITPSGFSEDYYNLIGYLPQNQEYYNNFTGLEFIEYMIALKKYNCKNSKEYALKLLNDVNLADVSKKKIKTYSGGMKQRIGIAQALIGNPELLIFDEPTAGLDPEERIRFRNIISLISTNKIVIISTHIVNDISYIAKEIIMLDKGEIIMSGLQKDIINTINDKVWEYYCEENKIIEQMKLFKVSNVMALSNGCILRVVSDTQPYGNAKNVPANLEDVCLYCFNEVDK
jgi:ABC-type multidrug transport system ATPase subunit